MTQHKTTHHTKTKKGMPIGHVIIIALLVINILLSAFVLLRKDPVWKAEEMKVGGQENFAILKELYSSEEFKNQQKQGLVSALSSFGNNVAQEDTTVQPENNDAQPTAAQPKAEETKGDESMIQQFENIKESGYIKGDEDARFTILEYSEALCPYCKRQKDNGTIQKALEKYPNQVNTMFRHFIVHAPAVKQAVAIECAGEVEGSEGFYAYIKALFNENNAGSADLVQVADNANIDTNEFESCLANNNYDQIANDQTSEGRSLFGVRGTPGNVIIDNETGRYVLIAGAYPFEKFDQEIQNLLNK